MSNQHITDQIIDYLDKNLSQEEYKKFLIHINSCEECKNELEDTKILLEILENLEPVELPENFHSNFMKKLSWEKEKEKEKNKEDNIIKLPTRKKIKEKKKFNFKNFIYASGSVVAACIVILISNQFLNKKNTTSDALMSSSNIIAESEIPNQEIKAYDLPMAEENLTIPSESGLRSNFAFQDSEIKTYKLKIKSENIEEAVETINNIEGYNYSSDLDYGNENLKKAYIDKRVSKEILNSALEEINSLGIVSSQTEETKKIQREIDNLIIKMNIKNEEKIRIIGRMDLIALNYTNYYTTVATLNERVYELENEINELNNQIEKYRDTSSMVSIEINIVDEKIIEPVKEDNKSLLISVKETFLISLKNTMFVLGEIIIFLSFISVPLVIVLVIFFIYKRRAKKNEKK